MCGWPRSSVSSWSSCGLQVVCPSESPCSCAAGTLVRWSRASRHALPVTASGICTPGECVPRTATSSVQRSTIFPSRTADPASSWEIECATGFLTDSCRQCGLGSVALPTNARPPAYNVNEITQLQHSLTSRRYTGFTARPTATTTTPRLLKRKK